MDFELTTENGGGLEIFQDIPEDIKRFGKLQSECITVLGDFGKALFYQFKGNGVTVRYSIYDMLVNTVLKARSSERALELRIAIENQIVGTWDGIRAPSLAVNHFSLSFTPHVQTRAEFTGGKSYVTCDLHFEQRFLVEMAKDFPILADLLENVQKGIPTDISGKTFVCTPDMNEAIRFIEKNPYGLRSQKYVVEYRTKEILLAALEKMAEQEGDKPMPLDKATIDALHFGKALIEGNVEEELSLAFLCRKTGLNEYKFKKGFKTLFQNSAIDYHIRLRMEKAKELLRDTDEPIASIAYTVGYHYPANFSIEFKRRFGCTPKDYRKYGKKIEDSAWLLYEMPV